MTKRDAYLRRKWGITEHQFLSLLKKQGGVCPICLKPPKKDKNFHVEHDHRSGEIRGVVDFWCNKRVIGRYTEKDIDMLLRLVTYLSGYTDAPSYRYTGWFAPKKKPKKRKKRARKE